MSHKPVIKRAHPIGSGTQEIYRFANGYGASVVQFFGSYGFDEGLKELAVVRFKSEDNEDYYLVYDTPVTDDVIGHLTDMEVEEHLDEIAALPAKEHV